MLVAPCGAVCDECPYLHNGCEGCRSVDGKVFWAADHTEIGICPMYDCSINKNKFHNCGECGELPCNLFTDMKDPGMSDEEHKESIIKRVNVLKAEQN